MPFKYFFHISGVSDLFQDMLDDDISVLHSSLWKRKSRMAEHADLKILVIN